jgi:hypothetical protein
VALEMKGKAKEAAIALNISKKVAKAKPVTASYPWPLLRPAKTCLHIEFFM